MIASVHTWQPLSMCRQNSIRGSAKNQCWVVLFTLDALSILLMLVIKLIYLCYEAQSEKDDLYSRRESNSGHVWLELPLNHDSQTTTNPQNSLYVLHRYTCACFLHKTFCDLFLLLCIFFLYCHLGMVREKKGERGGQGEDAWTTFLFTYPS